MKSGKPRATSQTLRAPGGSPPRELSSLAKGCNITDIRNPRPPTRTKVTPDGEGITATTFGKSGRESARAIGHAGKQSHRNQSTSLTLNDTLDEYDLPTVLAVMRGGGTPQQMQSRLSKSPEHVFTSLRTTPGVHSSWANEDHKVTFRGTVDLKTLLGRRRAQLIDTYSVEQDALNRKEVQRFAAFKKQAIDPDFGPSNAGLLPKPVERKRLSASRGEESMRDMARAEELANTPPRAKLMHPAKARMLQQGARNLGAVSVLEGRPVSTFGGPGREHASKAPLSERQYPGPGQYHTVKNVKHTEKGVLVGGRKERGEFYMTKKGLIAECRGTPGPVPRSRPATVMGTTPPGAGQRDSAAASTKNKQHVEGRMTPQVEGLIGRMTPPSPGLMPIRMTPPSPGLTFLGCDEDQPPRAQSSMAAARMRLPQKQKVQSEHSADDGGVADLSTLGSAADTRDTRPVAPAALNSEIIKKVSLFEKSGPEVIAEVAKCLKPRVCQPKETLVRKGEMGTEMYFISEGELDVVNDQDAVVFTLKAGGFFGEIALLYETKRTASIVAKTSCDLLVLTKDNFKKVMKMFPEQSEGIKEATKTRFQSVLDASSPVLSKPWGGTTFNTQLKKQEQHKKKILKVQ